MSDEKDYILGTHDEEIARLGLQHRVWRPRALDAWRRAGFTVGQTLMDIGCGPGYASVDLAEIVGSSGQVVAIDRSRRFLDALNGVCAQRGVQNIIPFERDLAEEDLPVSGIDGAWARWVFAFVNRPRRLLERVHSVLKPGGVFVLHEYIDYSTWRVAPRSPEIEDFVRVVMESWRADGGEPDIGLDLPLWLQELGFEIKALNPIIDVIPATNFVWQWPRTFLRVGLQRLTDLGRLTPEKAEGVKRAFDACEARPGSLLITPTVLEIIAVRS